MSPRPAAPKGARTAVRSTGVPHTRRSYAEEALVLLEAFAAAGSPLPRVRALHLPPRPTPGDLRGEFCALELDDGAIGLSYVLLGDTWAALSSRPPRLALAGLDALRNGEPTATASRKFALLREAYPGWDTLLRREARARER